MRPKTNVDDDDVVVKSEQGGKRVSILSLFECLNGHSRSDLLFLARRSALCASSASSPLNLLTATSVLVRENEICCELAVDE
jgi:hypothetical protein